VLTLCDGRFHAWQSSLLFTALFVVHLLFLWSTFLSWVIFLLELGLIAWLVLNAYRDADTLDRLVLPTPSLLPITVVGLTLRRYEVPIVGPIASRFLDDE
jgi:uncharacterized membrane protein